MANQKKKIEVGVKELKNKTTQIIRDVKQKGNQYIVTVDGNPVAVIISIQALSDIEHQKKRSAVLDDIKLLAKEVSKDWKDDMSAAESVSEQRRG